jgi:hypothetical protein
MATPVYCRSVCYDDSGRGPARDYSASALTVQQLVAQCAHCAAGGGGGAVTNDHFWTIAVETVDFAARDNLRENVPANPAMPAYTQTFLFGSPTTESTAAALPNRMMYIHTTEDPLNFGAPDEGFFAAGIAGGSEWNFTNRGLAAAVFNRNNVSSGTHSFTAGESNLNSGPVSACFGSGNIVRGAANFMIGQKNLDNAATASCLIGGNGNSALNTFNGIVSGAGNTVTRNNSGLVIGNNSTVNGGIANGQNFVGGFQHTLGNATTINDNNIVFGRGVNTSAVLSEFRENSVFGNGHQIQAIQSALFNTITGQAHTLSTGFYQSNLLYGDTLSFLSGSTTTFNVVENLIGGVSHQCAGSIFQNMIGGSTHTINTSSGGNTTRCLIGGLQNQTQDADSCLISGNANTATRVNNSSILSGTALTIRASDNSALAGNASSILSLNAPPVGVAENMCNFLFANTSTIDNTLSNLVTSRLSNNSILGGTQNIMQVPSTLPLLSNGELLENAIIGGSINSIFASSTAQGCGIYTSNSSQIRCSRTGAATNNSIVAGASHVITAVDTDITSCAILGGSSHTITTALSTSNLDESVILGGTNLSLQNGVLDSQTAYAQRMRIQQSIQHEGFVVSDDAVYFPLVSDHLICIGTSQGLYNVELPLVLSVPDGITYYIRAAFLADAGFGITVYTPVGSGEVIYGNTGTVLPAGGSGDSEIQIANNNIVGTITGIRLIAKHNPLPLLPGWFIVSTMTI